MSPDPEQQFLYVGGGKDIVVVDRKTLDVVGEIEVPGRSDGGHHIATDSKGNIYIAADHRRPAEAGVQGDVGDADPLNPPKKPGKRPENT